jgi:diaminopimelate epimerase
LALVKVKFAKMHGAGNDFIMIDDREGNFPCDGRRIAAMAARRTGVGSEGVIVIQPSSKADFRMRFFNPDGSEAELCGNGARCVAAFAKLTGAAKGKVMCFETPAGVVDAEILDEAQVKVWMPDPKDLKGDFINSGVPHKIEVVENLAKADVESEGRRIRLSDEFAPFGTNVDFVSYRPPHRVSIRTYERGVEAETGACGTGSVAAACVGVARYSLSFPVQVKTAEGYELVVDGEFDGNAFSSVTLTGPVKLVFEGVIDLDSLEAVSE